MSRKYPYSPTEGIGISWGVGFFVRPKNLKKCVKLYWNFQKVGGLRKKSLLWGRYGYFLELHNSKERYENHSPKLDFHVS